MKYIQYDPAEFDKITVEKADDVDALKARIAELEAALKQTISAFDNVTMDEGSRVYTSLRAARAALGEKE